MPMRRSLASRPCWASTSSHTRVMIAPTVRHAMRISSITVDLAEWVANHATVWSKV